LPTLELKIKTGDLSKPSEQKFSHYYHMWLRTKESNKGYQVKKCSYDKVNEHFGDMKITSITRLAIKKYILDLEMKPDSKRPYLSAIRGTFEAALDDEIITVNHAINIPVGEDTTEDEEVYPFTPEEVDLIISSADGWLKNYLAIAFYTGMRPSEILGLMHNDISENTISIQRSVTRWGVGKTKTKKSKREIPIFDAIVPYIKDQMKRSKALYLFEKKGEHLKDVQVVRYQYQKLMKSLDIEYRTIYNTRHTFATTMLNSGQFKMTDIAAMLGHANVRMLITTYAKYINGDLFKIDRKFDPFGDSLVTPKTQSPIFRGI